MLQGDRCVQGAGPYHIYVTQDEDKNVDSITYRLVMTTDRSTLQTGIQSRSNFFEFLLAKLNIMLHHPFTIVSIELKFRLKTGHTTAIYLF